MHAPMKTLLEILYRMMEFYSYDLGKTNNKQSNRNKQTHKQANKTDRPFCENSV